MDSKKKLLLHSEAKVGLYAHYLSIYLNVIARSYIKNIYLFDLFCGEGIYQDGGEGSPIVALECIKRHYQYNNQKCPNIFFTINDSGYSEIDPNKFKSERVKEFADKIFRPPNVKVGYTIMDYHIIIPKVIARTNKLSSNERALIFIDPWGYKEINSKGLKNLLENGKTEILLFLPINFMYRIVEKAKDFEFKGGEGLRNFMNSLFGSIENFPRCKNQVEFIEVLRLKFKEYLNIRYVDFFKIERDNNKLFALFFFTNNTKGFQKMLESKWSKDKKQGSGFKQGDKDTLSLFDETDISGYEQKVYNHLIENKDLTNQDLFSFGLANNFLPSHTKKVLDKLKVNPGIEIISLDKKPATSYYLGNEDRIVNIKLK